MQLLASYLSGSWSQGSGPRTTLVNPATEAALAEVSNGGHDFAGAFAFARSAGIPGLGALTFAQRGALLGALAKAIHGAREELINLAVANGGNTRGDAKFDVDGGALTLSYYAELGAKLGSAALIGDGEPIQVGRTARMGGQHVWARRRGVAVHINAFNFPGWGLCEKLACSLLAGMPTITKPATATAMVGHRMVELFAPLLPAGALQLLVGPAGSLLDHLGPGDVVAFTGGSATARMLRGHAKVIEHSVRLNIEADSLNAAILGPDVDLTSETGGLFLADVVRDMTQKTGQKCTAIRRVLVPAGKEGDVFEAMRERLGGIAIGDPSRDDVRMGPLATAQQKTDVLAGIARLAAATDAVFGGTGEVTPIGVPAGKGFFVGPVVRSAKDAMACAPLNEHEVFGPVTTVAPYSGDATYAADFVARGDGCLVSSAYSDERDWVATFVGAASPWAGRLYLGSAKMAAMSPGPGTALPSLLHGGPGRAGGGEELGGVRGLQLYLQRTALEGDASVLKSLLGGAALNKLWMAIGAVAFIAAVAFGVWNKKQSQAKEDQVWVDREKAAILEGLELCETSDASLAAAYAMATAQLANKAAVDPKAAIRLIRETIRPVLDSRQTICAGVEQLATNHLATHPDPKLRAARDQTREHLARLKKTGSSLDRLTKALASSTSKAEINRLVTSATTPPP